MIRENCFFKSKIMTLYDKTNHNNYCAGYPSEKQTKVVARGDNYCFMQDYIHVQLNNMCLLSTCILPSCF